ncbi:unnamed protein product, partial [marine sediment metagenome]
MMKLLPVNAQGVIFIDAHKAMSIEVVDKAIKDEKAYKQYLEFVEKTGIDPKEDLNYITAAMFKGEEGEEGVGIVNIKHDPQALLSVIKKKAQEEDKEFLEEEYNGMNIYYSVDEGKKAGLTFLDKSNIAVGTLPGMKAVIDVFKGNKDNVYKNEELSTILKKVNKKTLVWGAVLVPPKAASEAAGNPMLPDMTSIKSVSFNIDYKNKNIMLEIKGASADAEKNQKIATQLNGFKSLGAMAAAEKPEIGELMNAIIISSTDESITISATIPEELLTKLKG